MKPVHFPLLIAVLLAALLAVMLFSLTVGRYPIPTADVIAILGHSLSGRAMGSEEAVAQRVIEQLRLPRVMLAALAGAGLSAAGAALQSLFRNPLVAPDILGISAGAAFGGALAISLAAGSLLTVMSAFVFGVGAVAVVTLIAAFNGRTSTLALVLSGVVTGALFNALISLLTFLADVESELPTILYWLLGSFATAGPERLVLLSVAVLPALVVLRLLAYRLNTVAMGEEDARSLGTPVGPLRWLTLTAVAVIVAASVAVAGIIGWVGLVVPHLARPLAGPDNRRLLPAAALMGAAFLVVVDTLCRSISHAEIPLSVLTALLGAPLFILLLRRAGGMGWGRA